MSIRSQGHALVIGASMTGLCAARALRAHFAKVTLLDRDEFAPDAEFRSGVPQSRHIHLVLGRGLAVLQTLFPELHGRFEAARVPLIDLMRDLEFTIFPGRIPRYRSRHETRACSRGWLESTLRSILLAEEGIELRSRTEVTSLRTDASGRVCGAALRGGDTVHADLVIDASGRGSKAREWLAALGYPEPPVSTINAQAGYATRWYRKPQRSSQPWLGIYCGNQPLANSRIGVLFPMEDERWVLTVSGIADQRPPTDEAGFLEFTQQLAAPTIAEAVRDLTPLSPIYGYRATENRWLHFERLERWPDGFIVLGDATCCFNPVYGQGMSVSAMEAELLDRMLRRTRSLPGFARRFQRALPSVLQYAWMLSTGEDLRWPTTQGASPSLAAKAVHWYVDRFLYAMIEHRELVDTFVSVQHLHQAPTALFRPGHIARVTAHAARAYLGQFSEPASV